MAYDIHRSAYADHVEQPGIVTRLRQTIAYHRKYLATYDELNALSDLELDDLNLSRASLRDIAR